MQMALLCKKTLGAVTEQLRFLFMSPPSLSSSWKQRCHIASSIDNIFGPNAAVLQEAAVVLLGSAAMLEVVALREETHMPSFPQQSCPSSASNWPSQAGGAAGDEETPTATAIPTAACLFSRLLSHLLRL